MGDNTLRVETEDLRSDSQTNQNAFEGEGSAAVDTTTRVTNNVGEETLRGVLGDAFVDETQAKIKAYQAIVDSGVEHGKTGVDSAGVLEDGADTVVSSLK